MKSPRMKLQISKPNPHFFTTNLLGANVNNDREQRSGTTTTTANAHLVAAVGPPCAAQGLHESVPPPPDVPTADDFFVNGNFIVCHHNLRRQRFFDQDDDADCQFRSQLAAKRVTCGEAAKGVAFRIEDDWARHRPFETDPANRPRLKRSKRLSLEQQRHPQHAKLLEEGWTGTTTFITKQSTFKPPEPITAQSCDESPKRPGFEIRTHPSPRDYHKGAHRENTVKFSRILDVDRRKPRAARSALIEVCCQSNSELCSDECGGPHRKLVRIIAGDDIRTAKGLQKAIDAIKDPDVGHLTAWFATLCTWGTWEMCKCFG